MNERVAIYCRLSQEDRDKSDPQAESRSIQNQKSLLLDYAREQGWVMVGLYSDEDYSGSDRDRPAFRRLLRDAEAGKFSIILCKSQSRFTRELELVEKYINGLFLDWGIRFVGVADHVDTANLGGKKARQLSGLINQWYLEDLSDSIRSVLRSHQRQGRHIGSFAPYGYQKDPNQAGHLIVDEAAAQIVRRIFHCFVEGNGKTSIARMLNREKIPNPSRYKELQGSAYRCKYGASNSGLWRYSTVDGILRNPVYIGSVAQHRSEKISYKSEKMRSLPRDQWLIVPNRHEAIIPLEQWERVQNRLQSGMKSFGGYKGIFAGKLRCLYCGSTLRRCKSNGDKCYYKCSAAQVHSGCIGGFIPHKELCEIVWQRFEREMEEYFDAKLLPEADCSAVRQELKRNEAARKVLYLDKIRGNISEDWYLEAAEELRNEEEGLQRRLQILREAPQPPRELSQELIDSFIQFIAVGKRDKSSHQVPVEIHWKF